MNRERFWYDFFLVPTVYQARVFRPDGLCMPNAHSAQQAHIRQMSLKNDKPKGGAKKEGKHQSSENPNYDVMNAGPAT